MADIVNFEPMSSEFGNSSINREFIKNVTDKLNEIIESGGSFTLNDVLDMLGLPRNEQFGDLFVYGPTDQH